MGANRSGDNRQKRIKRHLKNLRTQAAAEPSATPKRKRPRAAKAQRRSAGS